jgi:predicted heme/steroid binding protein
LPDGLEIYARGSKIRKMSFPDRIVSDSELRRNTGGAGTRKYIAYKGIVFDVTDCPKWRPDLHEQLHFAGQDLTSELPDAPHKEEVFEHDCVKIVGKLAARLEDRD